MNEFRDPTSPNVRGRAHVYFIKEWSLALVCPMVVTFSFFMAVIDPEQRPAFSDLATVALTSSGTFLLSKYEPSKSGPG